MISLELRSKIRRLYFGEHWKIGTIVSELGVHPDTVKNAIGHEKFFPIARPLRPSKVDPFRAFIVEQLEKHPRLRATRLHEMVRLRGYTGSVTQLRRFVKAVRPRRREAFLRLETLPGEQGQVDWASFDTIRIGRALRKLSCFVMVLSFSRAIFARFALDQTSESFILGHRLAFEKFQGVPRNLLYDNLKSVVLEREGQLVRYHPRILELAGHYHFAPQPCAPYRGNEKGKVERAIHYIRYSFFEARHFTSLDDLNRQLRDWLDTVAMMRPVPPHQDRTVRDAFEEERQVLLPLPEHPFEADLVRPICSGKTPYVRFDANDYSIPPARIHQPLTLAASEKVVRILDGTIEVARHDRSYDRGRRIEDPEHLRPLADEKRRARELRGRDRLRAVCPHAVALLEAIAHRGDSIRAHTSRLVLLLDRYDAGDIDLAIQEAVAKGACSAQSVEHILDQNMRKKKRPPALPKIAIDKAKHVDVIPHRLDAYDRLARRQEGEPS